MKLLAILLVSGTCSTIIDLDGCGKREIKYPCPDESPNPSPSPSIIPSPIPSPSINPSPSPSPSTSPSPIPTPSPVPSPTPSPGNDLTESGNYPRPAKGTCPAKFKDSLYAIGTQYRSTVPVKSQGIYLGIRINVDGTPKSRKPFCEHSCYDDSGKYSLDFCRLECEQWPACQNPAGVDIYMTLPGKWTNEICDENSSNPYYCHHKPKLDEKGPTTFTAHPRGMKPGDPWCENGKRCKPTTIVVK